MGAVVKSPSAFRGRVLRGAMAASLFAVATVCAGSAHALEWLRVCADPDNMPFSNHEGRGFENKLAELMARKLGAKISYTWIPERRGLLRHPMGDNACDLVMGYAQGSDLVEDTNPYYYTSYVLIHRADDASLAGIDSLQDPRLKTKRIGLVARTPPASMLAMNGLTATAKPFEVGRGNSISGADAMIDEVANGTLDAALLWGPVGGYAAQRSPKPLNIVPLIKEQAGPSAIYAITMGVRPNEPQWKHQINKVIEESRAEIDQILLAFNVPVLDAHGKPVEPRPADR